MLVHADLVPPERLRGKTPAERNRWKTEYGVRQALRRLGHEVQVAGLRDDLSPLEEILHAWKPHLAFNLLEEFRGEAIYDASVVSYLELKGIPVTGCNPRGLVLARDKAASKHLVAGEGVRVPSFSVFARRKPVRAAPALPYPLIVKSRIEEASLGISQASIVHNERALRRRIRFVHERLETDAVAERYIEGREFYVGVLGGVGGGGRPRVLPPLELLFRRLPGRARAIASEHAKHSLSFQKRWGVTLRLARNLPERVPGQLARESRTAFEALGLSGYARMDFRLDAQGRLFFLEANPNPEIARGEEMARAAAAAGLSYQALLTQILRLALAAASAGA